MAIRNRVCPWWLCFTFSNPLRRLLHDPVALLSPYVRYGSTVIDIGPGMGYFSIPLANLVGASGRVIAVDVQARMLSSLMGRARRRGISARIFPHLAAPDSLGDLPSADFVLAFWMAHEVPDPKAFFGQVRALLKPEGRFLVAEPRFHVREEDFLLTLRMAESAGFAVADRPKIGLSRTALFTCR